MARQKMERISFITCVNDFNKYLQCVKNSLAEKEKNGSVELIAIFNSNNQYSIPQALNEGILKATGTILVCYHQDVEFPADWISTLWNQIAIVKRLSYKWGVLGTFGIDTNGVPAGHIIDRGIRCKSGDLPCRVQSLDECCLIFRKDSGLRFDEQLGGYHLYGADICLTAQTQGFDNYAIDACLHHRAAGNKLNESFYQSKDAFIKKWKNKNCPFSVLETTCTIILIKPGIRSWINYKKIKQRRHKLRKQAKQSKIFFTLDMESKPDGYFGAVRREMLDFIEHPPKRTLEFGCGDGSFSAVVYQKFGAETWAVERDKEAAEAASKKLFKVICADAEKAVGDLPEAYFDSIFLFDFLEHLVDPYRFLKQLKDKMTDSGVVIASIPNIRHYKTVIEYLFKGEWSYRNAGTLDITHLRFFTYKSILHTFKELGFQVYKIQGIHKSKNKILRWLNVLLFGKLEDMKYLQFAVVASPDRK
ncbi:MAG: methyltransferase domain-containing protein [Smithella sp.]|nr:methyltransferase domain-containing protein [Smithella sp.]